MIVKSPSMTKVTKMLIRDNIRDLIHVVIRSHSWDLQEEVLGELYGEWENLTTVQQKDILSDMRWWTAIARHTPTEQTKEFLDWAQS